MVRLAVLGDPIAHSLSPVMHQAALDALGIRGQYERWHIPRGGLAGALQQARAEGYDGLNLTAPHKVEGLRLADRAEEEAARAGAANTLYRSGARLVAANTDGEGLLAALRELGVAPRGARVAFLGAGGAARTAGLALVEAGARISLVVRDPDRAGETAARLGAEVVPLERAALDALLPGVELLVNALPVAAMEGLALPLERLPRGAALSDLSYAPGETPLVHAARAAGYRAQDGAAMLLHQGAAAFARFTGQEAPVESMRAALYGALGRR